jgi:alkylation response protein AidB-like acyl-CoA dehydrogenase
MCTGGAKAAIGEAARYASERRQFGQPIASFGAIKHKLGEMTARTYAVESMLYRTAGLIDAMLDGRHDGPAVLAALEEFAVEASIAKVAGSEVVDYVLDENVQIHGGNGFVRDYPAERHYRDARVNRIFEGTNEINRLLIPGLLIRRAIKGDLALIPAAKRLQDDVLGPTPVPTAGDGPLAVEQQSVARFKKVALMTLGTAMQKYGEKLSDEQEILSWIADVVIDLFGAESAVLRAGAATRHRLASAELQAEAVRCIVNDAAMRIEMTARQVLAAMAEGDMLRTQLAALRRLLKPAPVNTVSARRRLAEAALTAGTYPFDF